MVATDSDLISDGSVESLFSNDSAESDREKAIRRQIMIKLIEKREDERDKDCAVRIATQDLIRGVGG